MKTKCHRQALYLDPAAMASMRRLRRFYAHNLTDSALVRRALAALNSHVQGIEGTDLERAERASSLVYAIPSAARESAGGA